MRSLYTFLAICLLLAMTSTGHAESPLSRTEPPLIVVINDTPPWKWMENGKAKGIDIDITDEIASRLNVKVEYRYYPFKRCLESLERGEADLMGFLAYREERAAYLQYLQPPYQGDTKVFYVRRGEADRLKTYSDLHKLRVGLMRGHKHFEPFDSDKKIDKHEADHNKSNYLKLVRDRIDVLIENDTQGPYKAHRFGVADKVEIAPYTVPMEKNGFFAMSKKSKFISRIAEFENVLRTMVNNGEIDAIIMNNLEIYQPGSLEAVN